MESDARMISSEFLASLLSSRGLRQDGLPLWTLWGYLDNVFLHPDPDHNLGWLARYVLRGNGEQAADDETAGRLAREIRIHLVKARVALGIGVSEAPTNWYTRTAGTWGEAWHAVSAEQKAEAKAHILAELDALPAEQRSGASVGYSYKVDKARVEARLCALVGTDDDNPPEGMLALDRVGADFLARLGATGQNRAEALRGKARERWQGWQAYKARKAPASWCEAWKAAPGECPDLLHAWSEGDWQKVVRAMLADRQAFPTETGECPFVAALATCVWLDVVKPRIEAERRRVPALATPVVASLVTVATQGAVRAEGLRLVTAKGLELAAPERGQIEAVAKRLGRDAPNLVDAVLHEVLTDCVRAVQTLQGQRLLRYLVRAGAGALVSAELAGHVGTEKVVLALDGGFDKLRSEVGAATHKAIPKLREALAALELLRVASDNHALASAWLLQCDDWRAAPGRPARLEITLNWPLLPIGGAKLQGHGRLLVPMPETVPALVGREREHGAQANMHLRMMMHFAERSPELAEKGGLLLTEGDWHKVADESGVPRALVADIQSAWYKPGGLLIPPVLRAVDDKRTTLHDDKARELLTEQGRIRVSSSRRSKRRKPRKE
jgi:hypothetical protein